MSLAIALGLLPAFGGLVSTSQAATINYSDVGPVPPGIMFTDIRESSVTDPVPLFGEPDGFTTGLDFDPIAFGASALGGTLDVTDGQLNFTIMGNVNLPGFVGINSFSILEEGDYELSGTGTATTQVRATLAMFAEVTQINGVDLATPVDLTPVNSTVSFNLAANEGSDLWDLGANIDVNAQLALAGFGPNDRATKIKVVLNNRLSAISEASSIAFIAKKDFKVEVDPDPQIPEPATIGMLLLGSLVGLVRVRRRS